MNDALPPLEQALRALPLDQALATLALIEKLVRNTVHAPGEEKFRKIRLSNPKIAEAITNVPGAIEAMVEMGWQQADEEMLILPQGTKLVFETVKAILETQDWFKKEVENDHKRKMQAKKETDPEKLALRQQLENDAKERAAQGPVTTSSKARQLGGNGPNMVTPTDLGMNKSQGGG
jgi:DNA-binding TFAR19-related protein (PDSD5 family)